MSGHGEKLSRKQEQAISALLLLPTMDAAAKEAGISTRTLTRWLQQAAFRSAYMEARRMALGQAIVAAQRASAEAVETLREVMTSSDRDAARVTAARAIIETAVRGVEIEDMAARLESLELMIGGENASR